MPNLQEYRDAHYSNTGRVSENVRTLAISAIGVIWIFKTQSSDGTYEVPGALFHSVLFVFVAMLLDFMQYIYGSIAWGVFFRRKEIEGVKEGDELYASPTINLPTYIFFYGKVIVICFAYFFIIKFLIESINWV